MRMPFSVCTTASAGSTWFSHSTTSFWFLGRGAKVICAPLSSTVRVLSGLAGRPLRLIFRVLFTPPMPLGTARLLAGSKTSMPLTTNLYSWEPGKTGTSTDHVLSWRFRGVAERFHALKVPMT